MQVFHLCIQYVLPKTGRTYCTFQSSYSVILYLNVMLHYIPLLLRLANYVDENIYARYAYGIIWLNNLCKLQYLADLRLCARYLIFKLHFSYFLNRHLTGYLHVGRWGYFWCIEIRLNKSSIAVN